jgi:hypothetical protein
LKVVVGFSFCFFLVGEMMLEIQEWKKERKKEEEVEEEEEEEEG